MPRRPLCAFAVACATLSAGCGAPQYDAPVTVSRPSAGAAVGFLQTIDATVWPHGGTYAPAPAGARVLSARCEDASVCEALADSKAFVGGLKAGSTVVDLTIEHPTLHTTAEYKVPVSFRDVELTPMKLGNSAPQIDGKLQILTDLRGDPDRYFCEPSPGSEAMRTQLDVGDVVRGPAVFYVCAAPVALEHGRYFFRSDGNGSWGAPSARLPRRTRQVCVHERTRGREILSITVYEEAANRLSLVEHRGDADPVCAPKP